MSLLDSAKAEVKAESKEAAVETVAKKSNSEYQKKQRELRNAHAVTMRDWAAKAGKDIVAKMDAKTKEAFDFLTKEPKAGGNGGSAFGKPVIYQLFGDKPKVGDKITSLDAFKNTGKGFPEMKKIIKKWGERGIEVAYDEKAQAYVIKNGAIPAYVG